MGKLTDDEIMAQALTCPESEKVPLEVGDRVIALEDYTLWEGCGLSCVINKGDRGEILEIRHCGKSTAELGFPLRIDWDSLGYRQWGEIGPIGKLVPRRK